jgi:hypothetical protein
MRRARRGNTRATEAKWAFSLYSRLPSSFFTASVICLLKLNASFTWCMMREAKLKTWVRFEYQLAPRRTAMPSLEHNNTYTCSAHSELKHAHPRNLNLTLFVNSVHMGVETLWRPNTKLVRSAAIAFS